MTRGPSESLVLAVPSKGQLYEGTLRFLEAAQLPVRRFGQGREYLGNLGGVADVDVLFLRADEIPARVESGDVHAGITGEDLFQEHNDGAHRSYVLMANLGYGKARLVVAVPRVWIDVTSLVDLQEVTHSYRSAHGHTLRVATKFPRLTRKFFNKHGILDYRIVESMGATEGAPASGVADIIVDLTSTGATLAQNHLKEIGEGTLLSSEACLITSADAERWHGRAMEALEQIVEMMEARLVATRSKLLRFAVAPAALAEARAGLAREFNCEVHGNAAQTTSHNPTGELEWVEASTVCETEDLYRVMKYLRRTGCSHVTVLPCDSLFQESSNTMQRFSHFLRHQKHQEK